MKTLFCQLLLGTVAVSQLQASQPRGLKDIPDPDPAVQQAGFVVPEGFEISLFASDPMLQKPVQMNWDGQGRLWVVSSSTYPHIKPGAPASDQLVVLEDTNGDGKADKSTVFAEGLHIPTAVIPGDGGAYVANSTELIFLKDTDGDLKADERTILLSGFGTEDTHHLLHTLRHGPEGLLHFQQSIYIHSHIETPYGVRRLMGGGIWEFRPETKRLEIISKGLINPWGLEYDRWGQTFATDGAGSEGINFIFPGSVFATSPGAKRILRGLNPGQPKHSGLEIIEDPHFPEDWQGTLVTCDFRGNRINRFKLTETGSGYTSTQQPDVLASNHRAFRPIDVRVGPDGALYIADWYNPIIQHGEVDFRDERRDHIHGRIWRLSAKGRPLSKAPNMASADVPALLEHLKSPRRWDRHFAKQELRARGAAQVTPALDEWAAKLSKEDAGYSHTLLEAAWAREGVNAFSPKLWRELWATHDPRVKSAALRILSHRWKELPGALKLLESAVTDTNPQVRLWALAVLADMKTPQAFNVAVRVLDHPMDENLDFLLDGTAREQVDLWFPAFQKGTVKLNDNPKHIVFALKSTGRSDALTPLFEIVKKGKLAPEDVTAVLGMAGDTADAAQARQMADMVNDPALSGLQLGLLDALTKSASARGVKPEGAEELAVGWLASPRPEFVHRAAILAGAWKIEATRAALSQLITAAETPQPVREGAVQGLTRLGGAASRDFFDRLFREQTSLRSLAVQGLADVGPQLAATRAVEFLSQAGSAAEASPVIEAFLRTKQLPSVLAKALAGKTIPESVAVEAIRMVSSRGVQGPLVEALRKAGGVKQMDRPLTPDEMGALVAKVKAQGDPARGESIYRRQQLLCQTCHAIGEAGGVLGPNLVSIGGSAPIDYLIESLLEPSKKIKEGYHMIVVNTTDGGVVSGGLVQDGQAEIVIRDPSNKMQTIPKARIASRQMSPVSMMPPGMTSSLREDEFIDLVRFLSELGREGDYKIKPNRYVRTWKVMGPMTQADIDHVRHVGLHALNDVQHTFPWQPSFSRVSGDLALDEITAAAKMYPWFPKIAQFTVKMDAAGQIKLGLSQTQGVILVVGEKIIQNPASPLDLDLPSGQTPISVLTTKESPPTPGLRLEVLEGAGRLN